MDPYRDQYRPQPSNGMGIAALITGIVALILSFIPAIGMISWLLAPIAIILGIVGMNQKNAPRGTAIAGIATGGVALVICIMWVVFFGMLVANMPDEDRSDRGRYESDR
jgi:lysylphosphatidylglycerol synthetase-like protein (DUF2156 family)